MSMRKNVCFGLLLVVLVLGTASPVRAVTSASDLWLYDWDTGYVDLQESNSNAATSGWDFPDTSTSKRVTVGGDCADSSSSEELGELSMTLSGLTSGESYSIDAVVGSTRDDDVGGYSVLAGFTSGAENQTAYNNYQLDGVNKGRDVVYANRVEEGSHFTVRIPLGTQVADSNGEITVYFNEDTSHSNPWKTSGGNRAIIDGLIYAQAAAIPEIPSKLITSADRNGGTTYDDSDSLGGRPFVGIHDGETDPLESSLHGLRLGAPIFSDRTYCVDDISPELIGADYVRTFLGDKGDAEEDFSYDVTLTQDRDEVFLMVLVDDRFEDAAQGIVDGVVADFAAPGDFVDTGWDIDANDSSNPHPLSAFGKWMPTKDGQDNPITYTFGAVPDGSTSSYMIAATTVPEPSTAALLLAVVCSALCRRRQRT